MYLSLFTLGGLMCASGFVAYFAEYRYCMRLAKETAGHPDTLTFTDTWLNTRYFIKRRKLHALLAFNKECVRHDAAAALRLDIASKVLLFSGMLVMVLGVASG